MSGSPKWYVSRHGMQLYLILHLTSFPFFPNISVDHSRVKLENTENDYINASLVVMEEAQRRYILTQVSELHPGH